MQTIFKNFVVATILGLGTLGAAQTAAAADYYSPGQYTGHHACSYRKVVAYRTVRKPYVKWVTVYDSYGCAHRVQRTYYKTVQVPYVKWVKVCCH